MLTNLPVWGLRFANAESPRKAKIGQFEDAALGDENIGRFDVSMKNLVGMNVEKPIEQLLNHFLDLPQAEFHLHVGQQTGQVVLTEIKHQIKR